MKAERGCDKAKPKKRVTPQLSIYSKIKRPTLIPQEPMFGRKKGKVDCFLRIEVLGDPIG